MSADQRHSPNPILGSGPTSVPSRTLISFPIVHTRADMGALQESVARATLEKLGRAGLSRKNAAINQIWTEIEAAIDALPLSFDRLRLCQDGLPVCGREADIAARLAEIEAEKASLLQSLGERGGKATLGRTSPPRHTGGFKINY